MNKFIALFAIVVALATGCDSNKKRNEDVLPFAKGQPGEIILVMDSAKWEGQLGDMVREVFIPVVKGLPRPESLFTLRYIDPRKLNSVLKGTTNMVFVTALDSRSTGSKIVNNYFTAESRKKIKKNPDLFLSTDQNVFARGQEVMYLFGATEAGLIQHLSENKEKIQGHFNSVENKRVFSSLYKSKKGKGIQEVMRKEHSFMIKVPFGYRLVQQEAGFMWMRRLDTQIDRDIFVGYKDFTDEKQLTPDSVLALRELITKKYVYGDPENLDSYVTMQHYVPYVQREVNFNGKFAIETKGLWKTNNNSMGGPMVSYAFVDEALNRLYYIEGFVYSPGKSQREFMREIEIILSTFKTSEELQSSVK